jgi:RHS repeat-associated protein
MPSGILVLCGSTRFRGRLQVAKALYDHGHDSLPRRPNCAEGKGALFTDAPATVNTTSWHAWWPPAATAFAGGGLTFNTNGERNAISGLSLTAGNYEVEFVGPDNGAVSVAPYVQGHQNWTNYVEPFEKIGAQGQLAAKPWSGVKKWAMTIPAGPNGLASTHLDVRIVGSGSFTVTSMVLRRVAPPATVNVYDADGQRLVRKDPSGQLTVFLDGQEIVVNTGSATVVSAARYYSGSTLLAQRSTTGGLTYVGTDHQGTVTATLTAGGVVSRQRYKPYGAQRGSSNALPSERGFIGQIEDTSTGLSYLNARHYDTAIGMFLSVDPLFQPGNPMASTYGYGNASPTGNSDPTGMIVDGGDCTGSGCDGPVTAPLPGGSSGSHDDYGAAVKILLDTLHSLLDSKRLSVDDVRQQLAACDKPKWWVEDCSISLEAGLTAFAIWARAGGIIDIKRKIQKSLGFEGEDWILVPGTGGDEVRSDAFGNLLYGIIGNLVGLSFDELIDGPKRFKLEGGKPDPQDDIWVKAGFNLGSRQGTSISTNDVDRAIKAGVSEWNSKAGYYTERVKGSYSRAVVNRKNAGDRGVADGR